MGKIDVLGLFFSTLEASISPCFESLLQWQGAMFARVVSAVTGLRTPPVDRAPRADMVLLNLPVGQAVANETHYQPGSWKENGKKKTNTEQISSSFSKHVADRREPPLQTRCRP